MLGEATIPFLWVLGCFGVLTVVTLALRCYVRVRLIKAFRMDDWFAVAASVFFLSNVIGVFIGTYIQRGDHIWNLSVDQKRKGFMAWFINYLGYGCTITLARIAIGLFFLRITVSRGHRYFIFFLIGTGVVTWMVFTGIVFFQCDPISYYWDKVVPGANGHCVPTTAIVKGGFLYGAVCAAFDIAYILLPIHMVWTMNLSIKEKLTIVPLLSLAGVGCCAPLIRMGYLHRFYDPDYFVAMVPVALWSNVESGLAVTACNMATLRPFARQVASWLDMRVLRRNNSIDGTPICKTGVVEIPKEVRKMEVGRGLGVSQLSGA